MAANFHPHSTTTPSPIKPIFHFQQFHQKNNNKSTLPIQTSYKLSIKKMENPPLFLSLSNMINLFLLGSICKFIHKFITESNSFLKSLIPLSKTIDNIITPPSPIPCSADHCDDDVSILMEKMGLGCDGETMKTGEEEVCRIFEEREPSIEELRAAFDVFDHNGDGFIDEFELKRVAEILGLGKGCDLGDFQRMIRVFDEDSDGRIDADEFFGLMRKTLC